MIDRRRFLMGSFALTTAGVGLGRSALVHATPVTVTLWRLSSDWGYPLTTDTGSDTKSRCRGNACHNAAPHRFFLTEAEALAGRLHLCCLAQPVPVAVCLELDSFLAARRQWRGVSLVDVRWAGIDPALVEAFSGAACSAVVTDPTGPNTVPGGSPSPPSTPPPSNPGDLENPSPPSGVPVDAELDPVAPTALPSTGTGSATTLAIAGTVLAVGGVLVAASRLAPTDPNPS